MPESVFYRFFKKDEEPPHIVWDQNRAAYRLATSLFKTAELSVDDGEMCSAEETAARNKPCGVASIPKQTVADLSFTVKHEPEDGNDAHHLLIRPAGNKTTLATKLRIASRIVIPYPGLQMVHGDGSPVN